MAHHAHLGDMQGCVGNPSNADMGGSQDDGGPNQSHAALLFSSDASNLVPRNILGVMLESLPQGVDGISTREGRGVIGPIDEVGTFSSSNPTQISASSHLDGNGGATGSVGALHSHIPLRVGPEPSRTGGNPSLEGATGGFSLVPLGDGAGGSEESESTSAGGRLSQGGGTRAAGRGGGSYSP